METIAAILDYKCPCCGGALAFDSGVQKLKCPYCDTEFDTDTIEKFGDDLKRERPDTFSWDSKAGGEWQSGEEGELRSFICNSCGGEIVCDENTAATSCPFCGNPVVMSDRLSGTLKPDYVIPFKLDKKAAKDAFLKHISKKRLLPKVFKSQNHIDEIRGVYVPFWLFDTDVDAAVRYHATTTKTWSDSKYDYTETSHYSLFREGSIGFDNVPVDGSSKMADDLMESIEPFDFSEAVDFKTAYLAGYLADKYDVTANESIDRANERIKNSTEAAFARTVDGYDTVNTEASSINAHNGRAKYALYPVWMLTTTWNEQKYTFAMNGQTGKFVGDLPVDRGAYWKWWGIYTAIITAITLGGLTAFMNL